jgi:hypothetical protein
MNEQINSFILPSILETETILGGGFLVITKKIISFIQG